MKCEKLKQECFVSSKWLRLVFMLVFATISYFSLCLVWLTSSFQFLFYLFTGKNNTPLTKFSTSLGQYIADVVAYLCFNTEVKPFPFNEWPNETRTQRKSKAPETTVDTNESNKTHDK